MTDKLKTEMKNNSSVNKLTKNKSSDNSMDTETTKFNIIFTINEDKDDDDDSYEEFDSDDEEYETENEDEEVSSSEDDNDDETDDETDDDTEEFVEKYKNHSSKQNNKCDKNNDKNNDETSCNNIDVLYELLGKMKKMKESGISETTVSNENIIEQLNIIKKKCNNKLIQTCIQECKKELIQDNKRQKRKLEKHKEKNQRIFRKIIKNKSMLNEIQYFNKLDISEQKTIIKKIRDINSYDRCDKPSGEYYKIKNWVDTFMKIPFGKINKLPIHLTDGVEKCHSFMSEAQRTLDTAVYGLNDAKMQIMQILGQLITNPSSIGTAVAIHGPPGSGKTSLVKEGISKILNRPFAFIALGGATDSSFLEGHSYTYEGSLWGKIVQILIESKSMNPVIYFDELDKISDTPKGEEIVNILTHLTDTTQNTMFHDKYFSDIDFDLSKCIFIFSYNDESKVNPILKDRMYRIKTKGYDLKQKTIIGNQYLLPKIKHQVAFEDGQVIIQEEALHYIIENFCANEEGVRNLKRCIEIIYTKLNLFRLMKSDENLFESEFSLKVSFPFLVTKNIVDKLIKKEEGHFNYRNMYI